MNDTCNNRSLAVPLFLAGMGAGIAVTLLFAPMTGEATRNLIGNRVRRGGEWVKSKADQAGGFVATQSTDIRNRVADAADALTHG